ncbi:MAG: hypothetical protein AAGD11_08695 [Planctomycetota bacterium]
MSSCYAAFSLVRSAVFVRWIALLIGLSLNVSTASAGRPELTFDFGRTTECHDVTEEFAARLPDQHLDPDQRLIELKLRVSVHLLTGNIKDIDEVRIEISDCDSRLRVESFSPNTRLQSDYSDEISVTKTIEHGHSLGASLGGEAPVPLGDVVAHVLPSVNGGISKREVLTEKQSRLAPQYAVIASGTIDHEHGVFFKLRSSPQSTLEGSHEFVVRFVVSEGWRGDSLRVCCSATGRQKFLWTKQQTTWSKTCAPVAIYLAGDTEARLAAEEHIAQQSL